MCEPHWTPTTTSRAGTTVPTLSRHTEAERRPCLSHAAIDGHECPRPLTPAPSSCSPSQALDHQGVPETQRLTYAKKQPHGYGLHTCCVLRTRHVVNKPQHPTPALMDTEAEGQPCAASHLRKDAAGRPAREAASAVPVTSPPRSPDPNWVPCSTGAKAPSQQRLGAG